jgi:ABC-type cobalamin/Fe3+-siderophores transport system ATPase subunit
LELPAGEVGVIAGPGASGKTTLLEVAAGIRRPDSGQVLINGCDLEGCSERQREDLRRREVGWACRAGAGALEMRVLDYVSLPLVGLEGSSRRRWFFGRRLGSREPERRARAALRRLGVLECAELRWSQLAQTQRVYVELAQAVAREPSLVLADDLLAGMSRRGQREAMGLLRGLAGEMGCGVLVTTDDLDLGVRASRVWGLEEGKLASYGHRDDTITDLTQRRRAAS